MFENLYRLGLLLVVFAGFNSFYSSGSVLTFFLLVMALGLVVGIVGIALDASGTVRSRLRR